MKLNRLNLFIRKKGKGVNRGHVSYMHRAVALTRTANKKSRLKPGMVELAFSPST